MKYSKLPQRGTGIPGENDWKEVPDLHASAARGCSYGEHECRYLSDFAWKLGGFHVLLPGDISDWDVFISHGNDQGKAHWYDKFLNQWARVHPYAISLKEPTGDTGSPEALKRLESWISRCTREHRQCGGIKETEMPRRLLKIENKDGGGLRLVETHGKFGKYACLSHRWCHETELASLKKTNLESFKREIPPHLVYPLLKDVIKVVAHCGLEYVWIDCMCIIQDDAVDWAREAVCMASIYMNAFITIAATGCENGANGLFRSPSGYQSWMIRKTRGRSVFTRPRHELPVHKTSGVAATSPLLSRGWVFQEFKLSKRIVHFMKEELIWECAEGRWCECEDGTFPTRDTRGGMIEFSTDTSDLPWDWAIEQYTRLDFTNSSDRLPAIGGVAKSHAQKTGNSYLAGLWIEELENDLLWVRIGKLKGRPKALQAPTWSWASISSAIAPAENPPNSKDSSESKPSKNSSESEPDGAGGQFRLAFQDIASASVVYLDHMGSPLEGPSTENDPLSNDLLPEDSVDESSVEDDSLDEQWSDDSQIGDIAESQNNNGDLSNRKMKIRGWSIQPVEGGDEYGCLEKSQLQVQAMTGEGLLFDKEEWRTSMKGPTLPTAHGTPDSWYMKVGKINFSVRPDYDFSQPGTYNIRSGSPATFMEIRRSIESAEGIVLRCVDQKHQIYERIGSFNHGIPEKVAARLLSQTTESYITIQ
ncbi:unnamed protein product [Clonostachys byssicola]|uniref:Heterokaryon incompatibility domain-containing protein n=1 Tax=Clonostachys byssicola TaxID=160290 RepID=A0A9N9U660_9HYPO|nr:unnamed protein product [Clonostachys byssicola]